MERALVPGIALLAAVHLGIALWMVADSRGFYEQVGPFGAYNSHYIGDAAAFTGGVGLALAAALRWPALRGGVLATAAAVTGLHAFNHWTDLNAANGDSGADVFGAVSLTVQFAFTLLLVRVALRRSTA
jgi:hypothetical protein